MPRMLRDFIKNFRSTFLLLSVLSLSLFVLFPSYSQTPYTTLIIGTKVAEPFAMKDKDGKWNGISIDLWEKIANELNIIRDYPKRRMATRIKKLLRK